MIWTSSQLIIGFYFERYRPIASGFSCSGAGAGMLIISLLNTALVPVIDWRNTMRVQVALLIFVFFIGIAYLEVSPTPIGVVAKTEPLPGSSSDEYYGNFYVHNFLRDDTSSKASHILVHYHPEKKPSRLRRIAKCISPCFAREKPQKKEEIALHRSETSLSERKYIIRTDPIQREDLFYTGPADYEEAQQKQQLEGKPLELVGSEKQMQRVAYGLHHIQDYDSPTTSKTRTPGHPAEGRRHKKEELRQHWLKTKIARAFNRLFDFHLLKHFEFRLLLLSAFLYPMGFNIPFVYSRARATIPSNQAFLIGPAIGVTNFLVRIACGFLAYKLRTWTTYVCGGAVFATLRALIYVRYLGLAKLTNAFGISALAMGLGVFIGTTSGGVLIEQTGGYTIAFAFSGSCIMIAGGLLLALPTIVRNRDIRKQKKARELNN
ncbi:uncharacterized protein LOC115634226 [Scaptodrosophila lebanonensis]|uniref:Uncharacterized protein LOC115634226 n=1 Tax=Drosophila lebanonensis TaxID=7225 RepID=A0A6J2UGS8_DROLE|nr:uncharacterized protein LOC115634226 [Scaptodrosophila lebanonensis]